MLVTAGLFEAYLKCPTKCFLYSRGETEIGSVFVQWVQTKSASYRRSETNRLIERFSQNERGVSPDAAEKIKYGKWRLAMDLAAHTDACESRIHAVERITSRGRGTGAQFLPIRFVFTNKLSKDDKLLLAFDAFVLSGMLGREIKVGRLVHGDDHRTVQVNLSALTKEVRKLTQKITSLLSQGSPPDLVLNRHCVACEFQTRCRQKAIEKDDLSLLSAMTEKERKQFNSKGIFTVTQLSYTFRPRRRGKRVSAKREKYHHSLKALAIRERKIHVVGSPELKIDGTPVYLDVEGIPDRDFYYLIGVRVRIDGKVSQWSFWADSMPEEEKIWADFLGFLATISAPVLIHYGSFETTFLKRMCERYGAPPDGTGAANAVSCPVNLLSVIFAQIYFPSFSNGLKDIAGYLGFRWSDPKASGAQTIALQDEWTASRAPAAKQSLAIYNAEDCAALELIVTIIATLGQALQDAEGTPQRAVVHTENLKREGPYGFKRNTFSLPELEAINKAAYWDYQRERVYVKSGVKPKRAARSSSRHGKALSPNKTIECPAPQACPKCNSTKFFAHGKMSKTVYDLRFMRHGIKRWIARYEFHRYHCQVCGATFYPKERCWTRSKYGSDLIAYSLYQIIGLRLPQIRAEDSLNKLFGYSFGRSRTNSFKTMAAERYEDTYHVLIRGLCSGQLLHADETKMRLKNTEGFVWVFASMEEVAYVYSDTRQGDTLYTLLKDFRGVLVSDFYAAYDGIECPQQKCLIHLIRDLNDEVLKRPYDEWLKPIVKWFADLLKPIVETVDRYGLKSRFLRKHQRSVARFFKDISRLDVQSDAAMKVKERFEKNREKLFTFLNYDGVPWNNNNAEHAVKAFATLRQVIGGITSERGIHDYLILLSVCETCKFKGVDFLDFLRSGEQDINTFAESTQSRGRNGRTKLNLPSAGISSPSQDYTAPISSFR